MGSRSWLSAVLVVLAGASSIATSPRRHHTSANVEAPAVEGSALELTPVVPEQRRGAEVTVSRELVDAMPRAHGTIELSGSVRWLDPPIDPRNAILAVEVVAVGRPESFVVRKEIEIGRKAAQTIDLRQDVRLDACVQGHACTTEYEIRFEWVEPRGGRLAIAWGVDGSMTWSGHEEHGGATLRVVPIAPPEPPPADGEPNPFPASQ